MSKRAWFWILTALIVGILLSIDRPAPAAQRKVIRLPPTVL